MDNEFLKIESLQRIEKNYPQFSYFFEYDYHVFDDLKTVVFEICKCLIFGLNKSAITLTNYFLEKLMKLALVYEKVAIEPTEPNKWQETYGVAEYSYGSLMLNDTITKCFEKELITEIEKGILIDVLKNIIRNDFSHGDASKILKKLSDSQMMVYGNFDNFSENNISFMNINPKIVPFMQATSIDKFADVNAFSYFKKVFEIHVNIEQKLLDK